MYPQGGNDPSFQQLYQILQLFCVKFSSNWPSGSGEGRNCKKFKRSGMQLWQKIPLKPLAPVSYMII